MKAGLSEAQRTRTIALIRRALAMPQWRLQHGEHYLLTGQPVIVDELTSSIARSIELLLVAVLLAMAAALSLVFRGRPRLLPLAVAVLAVALTFGALAAVGASLDRRPSRGAAGAGGAGRRLRDPVPVAGAGGTRGAGAPDAPTAIRQAAAAAGPTILAAAAAGSAALLVMTLSPVPTVRGFALLLVVGIGIALLCTLTAGSAVLALAAGSHLPAAACGGSVGIVLARGAGAGARQPSYAPDLPRGARLRGTQPRPRDRRWPGARRARLGARHADARRNQPRKAGAPKPALAARPQRARGRLRGRRRNRSDGVRQERRQRRRRSNG